jgi:protease I
MTHSCAAQRRAARLATGQARHYNLMEHTMTASLNQLKIAILATDGFEQAELTEPRKALLDAGATVHVISAKAGQIQGYKHTDKGESVAVDKTFEQVQPSDYHGVVLPGGVVNGDAIRLDPKARDFVKRIDGDKKPIAVICHGGWLLVSTQIVKGHTLTSWPSLQDDIRNAGGKWVDQEVVQDGNLISSRKPDDLPAFNRALIEQLAQRQHAA